MDSDHNRSGTEKQPSPSVDHGEGKQVALSSAGIQPSKGI